MHPALSCYGPPPLSKTCLSKTYTLVFGFPSRLFFKMVLVIVMGDTVSVFSFKAQSIISSFWFRPGYLPQCVEVSLAGTMKVKMD